MQFSNAEKSLHGQNAQLSVQSILYQMQKAGYIFEINTKYRVGKEGYKNDKQFYAPFLISFKDNSKWALFTTTTMRTDRIKGQQWDAFNLKSIDADIKKAYIVYPDGLSIADSSLFALQNKKYVNEFEYSAIDGIVSQSEISDLIESYALNDYTTGKARDKQGNEYENRIAMILSYPSNLKKWKTGQNTLEGIHYNSFLKIVTCFGLDKNTVELISATSDKKVIGKLPSGGNPKTDVLVTVCYCNGQSEFFTISCKRSSEKSVSVHQYTAESFSNVLDPSNIELSDLLNKFQESGSASAMGTDDCLNLETELEPYLDKLSLWVLGGYGGDGNEKQCAKYILTHSNNVDGCSIHEINDYIQKLKDSGISGAFGTLFGWTYPSGRRGDSIQLKCKIL